MRKEEKALMILKFGTFISRFPSDGAASKAVKRLNPTFVSNDLQDVIQKTLSSVTAGRTASHSLLHLVSGRREHEPFLSDHLSEGACNTIEPGHYSC